MGYAGAATFNGVPGISPDPDDVMFLACAEAAKAHYLITGNIRHFPSRWKYTKIVTPRAFIDIWKDLRSEYDLP